MASHTHHVAISTVTAATCHASTGIPSGGGSTSITPAASAPLSSPIMRRRAEGARGLAGVAAVLWGRGAVPAVVGVSEAVVDMR
ncbi:hypothetical protein GCM10009099_12240 [Caenispirillum bisanense]